MDRFIVGTGRCGSTLLSRMLAENPTTLSVFEFFRYISYAASAITALGFGLSCVYFMRRTKDTGC